MNNELWRKEKMKNSMPVNNELPYIRVPRVLLSDP